MDRYRTALGTLTNTEPSFVTKWDVGGEEDIPLDDLDESPAGPALELHHHHHHHQHGAGHGQGGGHGQRADRDSIDSIAAAFNVDRDDLAQHTGLGINERLGSSSSTEGRASLGGSSTSGRSLLGGASNAGGGVSDTSPTGSTRSRLSSVASVTSVGGACLHPTQASAAGPEQDGRARIPIENAAAAALPGHEAFSIQEFGTPSTATAAGPRAQRAHPVQTYVDAQYPRHTFQQQRCTAAAAAAAHAHAQAQAQAQALSAGVRASAGAGAGAGAAGATAGSTDWVVQCPCGTTTDDGREMIQCESCEVWHHTACVVSSTAKVPDMYFCSTCRAHPSSRPGTAESPSPLRSSSSSFRPIATNVGALPTQAQAQAHPPDMFPGGNSSFSNDNYSHLEGHLDGLLPIGDESLLSLNDSRRLSEGLAGAGFAADFFGGLNDVSFMAIPEHRRSSQGATARPGPGPAAAQHGRSAYGSGSGDQGAGTPAIRVSPAELPPSSSSKKGGAAGGRVSPSAVATAASIRQVKSAGAAGVRSKKGGNFRTPAKAKAKGAKAKGGGGPASGAKSGSKSGRKSSSKKRSGQKSASGSAAAAAASGMKSPPPGRVLALTPSGAGAPGGSGSRLARRPYSPVTPGMKSKQKSTKGKQSPYLRPGDGGGAAAGGGGGSAGGGGAAAMRKAKSPAGRTDTVEDSEDGRANLQQLHLIRAFQDTAASKRPLLDANSKNITNPVNRMLTSNKFFKGRFFFNNGGCQSKECVLINFPKAGRGSVRLQVKAWHGDAREISSGANGASHPDTKAQFLSYIGWIFGVSGIDPSKIGTWPQDMEGTGGCDFCRTKVGTFQSDVYLCINPFHYVKPPKHSAMKIRLAQEMKTCLKDRPVLPGETPAGAHAGADQSAASKSRCYCLKCRKL
eukprot:gene7724-35434_t